MKRRTLTRFMFVGLMALLLVKFAIPICSVRKVVLGVDAVVHHDEAFVAVEEQYLGERRSLAARMARIFIWAGDDTIREDFTLWHLRDGKLQSFTIKNLAHCNPFIVDDHIYCGGALHNDSSSPQTWKWTGQGLEKLSNSEHERVMGVLKQRPDDRFFPKSEWHLKSYSDLHGKDSDKSKIVTPFTLGQNQYALVLQRVVRADEGPYKESLTVRFLSAKQNDRVLYSVDWKAKQVSRAEYEAVNDEQYKQ